MSYSLTPDSVRLQLLGFRVRLRGLSDARLEDPLPQMGFCPLVVRTGVSCCRRNHSLSRWDPFRTEARPLPQVRSSAQRDGSESLSFEAESLLSTSVTCCFLIWEPAPSGPPPLSPTRVVGHRSPGEPLARPPQPLLCMALSPPACTRAVPSFSSVFLQKLSPLPQLRELRESLCGAAGFHAAPHGVKQET